mmetsp:Transcript_6317/g.12821  ORF Transcript_6317/g.12821 Transcript_6317/m.12821 type:complete len:201 (-) Transcript_6317:572-1174(-)
MIATTRSIASFAASRGPSRTNSSWSWSTSLKPNLFRSSSLHTWSIAAVTMSAAEPWMQKFTAARSDLLRYLCSTALSNNGTVRQRPRRETARLFAPASILLRLIHPSTAGLLRNHFCMRASASALSMPKSSAKEVGVFPKMMPKLMAFACDRSMGNFSFTVGNRGSPLGPNLAGSLPFTTASPLSTEALTCSNIITATSE